MSAETFNAIDIAKGDRFEHWAKLRGDARQRAFICEVVSEPESYVDTYYRQRKIRFTCRTNDPATGQTHEGVMALDANDLISILPPG